MNPQSKREYLERRVKDGSSLVLSSSENVEGQRIF